MRFAQVNARPVTRRCRGGRVVVLTQEAQIRRGRRVLPSSLQPWGDVAQAQLLVAQTQRHGQHVIVGYAGAADALAAGTGGLVAFHRGRSRVYPCSIPDSAASTVITAPDGSCAAEASARLIHPGPRRPHPVWLRAVHLRHRGAGTRRAGDYLTVSPATRSSTRPGHGKDNQLVLDPQWNSTKWPCSNLTGSSVSGRSIRPEL